jgi:replication initiator protein RepSA
VHTATGDPTLGAHSAAFPGFGEDAPLDLPALIGDVRQQLRDLLCSPDRDAWSDALARVGNCARPIRLRGRSDTIDTGTGEVVASYSSDVEPLGITHVRCGNRRASECPSCSRLYSADMFQLIRAGVAGGKTVPASVAENPLVFATLTAPSFGAVHGRRYTARPCHPGPKTRCAHGRPRSCLIVHRVADPVLGQPLCTDCYDYASQVVSQWWAPDLRRRFTITLRRRVAHVLGCRAPGCPSRRRCSTPRWPNTSSAGLCTSTP